WYVNYIIIATSFDSHARLGTGTRRDQIDPRPLARSAQHHPLGDAEFHLARREVRDQYGQLSLELLGRVRRLDAGENGARAIADIERELQQLVRALDVLGLDDFRDAQVELVEVVDRNLGGHGVLLCFVLLFFCVALRRRRLRDRLDAEERVELLLLDASDEVLIGPDNMVYQYRLDVAPIHWRNLKEPFNTFTNAWHYRRDHYR